jgi:spore maturation protein CgeB
VRIVFFGLSISSAWGNGHATTYRALIKALHARGHEVIFFERDAEWYASNRDLPEPPFCKLELFDSWSTATRKVRQYLREADVGVVGSYFPDGIAAVDELLDSGVPIKAFYDIDTPITVSKLKNGGTSYLRKDHLAGFDLYFSFTGGPLLDELEMAFGVRKAIALYCSFDPDRYRPCPGSHRFQCDLSYMGTYAPDRQAKLDALLRRTALALPHRKFRIAGPQYPASFKLPRNVHRVLHVAPNHHAQFYCSSRLTLNLTRQEMVNAGYSPSVRLFEAAACGSAIVSDDWPGLENFFEPGQEILVADTTEQVKSYLDEMSAEELASIGRRARERALHEHHPEKRAEQFENAIISLQNACAEA